MNLIPIMMIVYITIATMFLYHQFTLVYVFFRQRCLHRVIPQNFVVLIQNLPGEIDTKPEIEKVLSPIKSGVRSIVSVPQKTAQLTNLYSDMVSQ